MLGKNKMDRRGSGPIWFVMLGIALFFLYSLAVAAASEDDCGSAPKHWEVFPPGWECESTPGFG